MKPSPSSSSSYTIPIITQILNQSQTVTQLKQTQSILIKANLIKSLSSLLPHHFTALIKSYSTSIFPIQSLRIYNHLCRLNLKPSSQTFTFSLKACSRVPIFELEPDILPLLQKGFEIHCRTFCSGFNQDVYVQNSLITMYSNCGSLDCARKVFDEIGRKSIVTWNAMAVAYNRCKDFESADWVLSQMPEKNVSSWNGLITRLVRVGDVAGARKVFDEMPERDSVSWNSMIAGYVRVKDYKSAVWMFKRMLSNGLEPTELTMVSVLGACAETGEIKIGREIYTYLKEKAFTIDGFVGNALLDMFAKCGNLEVAREIFDQMGAKHVSCWNSMIVALGVHGFCDEAIELFSKMDQKPNRLTYLGVLLAYSHKGLVKEGREFFRKMVEEYKVKPDIKHYGCMIDMLSRTGLVNEAYKMVKSMPIKANSVIWKTLLGACKVHGSVELAEEAFQELSAIGPLNDNDYVLMSNVYAEAGRWSDVERLRCGMIGQSISKKPGFLKGLGTKEAKLKISLLELGKVHMVSQGTTGDEGIDKEKVVFAVKNISLDESNSFILNP